MQITRRQWLVSATAVAAHAAPARYKPMMAVQVYVWTQQFGREKKTLAEGVEEMIPALRRIGYKRVEFVSQFFSPEMAERTGALLKKHRMEAPIVYNGGPMHEPAGAEKTITGTLALADRLQGLGIGTRAISFNPNPKRERKSDEELAIQAKALNELGGKLHERKLRFLIHQHAPEMQEGAREWRHILRNTDPKLVEFCLDIDWVKRGGQDPMTILKECGSRLGSLHLRSARQGVWMENFNDGDVDYREVAAWLKQTGFEGWITVELAYEKDTKVTRSLAENLRLSREYAAQVFAPVR